MDAETQAVARKIAEEASERACERLQSQIAIQDLKRTAILKEEIQETINQRFVEYFGMTPQEHLIEHSQIRNLLETVRGFWMQIVKKLAMGLLIAALVFSGSYATDVLKPKTLPAREDYKEEESNAPDS